MRAAVRIGDYVEVLSNAEGTAWRFGVVERITPLGAIISYGDPGQRPEWRLWALGIPQRLCNLRVIRRAN